jgi:hypothetical protein
MKYLAIGGAWVLSILATIVLTVTLTQPSVSDEQKARREATMFCAQLKELGGVSAPGVLDSCIEDRTAYMLRYLRGVNEGP